MTDTVWHPLAEGWAKTRLTTELDMVSVWFASHAALRNVAISAVHAAGCKPGTISLEKISEHLHEFELVSGGLTLEERAVGILALMFYSKDADGHHSAKLGQVQTNHLLHSRMLGLAVEVRNCILAICGIRDPASVVEHLVAAIVTRKADLQPA